ncbi:unnamed protein product [Owenia fusiformis]|uniref:Uncharacterized protein n=1 Tax=Owenia fusiformis TaxID=6347 RepID=A0A8J1XT98_OWEFU|nr:unnamed protein product [Owenia fusiformis]
MTLHTIRRFIIRSALNHNSHKRQRNLHVCNRCQLCTKSDLANPRNIQGSFKNQPITGSLHNGNQETGKSLHVPVMVNEVLEYLDPQPGQVLVDMTFGSGGHSKAIIERAPGLHILALDRDPTAYDIAIETAAQYNSAITPLLGKFSDLDKLLKSNGYDPCSIDGLLLDAGVSSMQFDRAERGFALSKDGPLDMRMDGNRDPEQPSAADVVNHIDETNLYKIIKRYGEEKRARDIAQAIIDYRYSFGPITRTKQLASIIGSVFSGDHTKDKLSRNAHLATKTFQALRIFVNNELNELNTALKMAHKFLKPGGKCVAISFHSLEDRIIKRNFMGIDIDAKINTKLSDHYKYKDPSLVMDKDHIGKLLEKHWSLINKKVVVPTEGECQLNPRARSAKLRAAIKVHEEP